MNTARAQGYIAFFQMKTLSDNPYCASSPLWSHWDFGWKDAKLKLQATED